MEMHDSVKSPVQGRVFLEKINIVLAISELDPSLTLRSEKLKILFLKENDSDYFTIVAGLYYLRNDPNYSEITKNLLKQASTKLSDLSNLLVSSEKTYLLLDLLSCPYVPDSKKRKWIKRAFKIFKESEPTNIELAAFFTASANFQSSIDWKDLDLLNSLERKELNSTY